MRPVDLNEVELGARTACEAYRGRSLRTMEDSGSPRSRRTKIDVLAQRGVSQEGLWCERSFGKWRCQSYGAAIAPGGASSPARRATNPQQRCALKPRASAWASAVAAGTSPTGRSRSFLFETVRIELRPLLVFRVAPTEDVSLEGHAAAAIHGGADPAEPRRRRIHRPIVDASFPDEEGPPALCLSTLRQCTGVRASRADSNVVDGVPDARSR